MFTWSDRILLDLHHASMVLFYFYYYFFCFFFLFALYLNPIGEALRDAPLGKARRKV